MSDTFTEVTTKGWGSRIGKSIKGVLFGLVLIVASVIGLFWNEGRAVQTAKSLAEGAGLVIDVDAARVDPANEGKLVHVSGEMKAGVQPRDPEFAVTADGLRLVRKVEMYQWKEEKKTETKKISAAPRRRSPPTPTCAPGRTAASTRATSSSKTATSIRSCATAPAPSRPAT